MDGRLEKVKTNDNMQKLTLGHILFLLGIFAKQFYLLPSGSLQIGDILMLCSFFCHFVITKKGLLSVHKDELYILGYVSLITIINGIYSLIYRDMGFMKTTLYYYFNIMLLLTFVAFIQDKTMFFLTMLRKILQCGLVAQLLIFVGGIGRWYSSNRYEGTFNDPNQYGVFIFLSLLIIYITGHMCGKKNGLWMLLGLILILPSASIGALIGCAVFWLTFFTINNYKTKKFKTIFILVLCAAGILVFCGLTMGYLKIPYFIRSMSFYKRFDAKVASFLGASSMGSIISDRVWNRVFDYPEYLLYGAGEGRHARFGSYLEIHSSILGPIFYYGCMPFSLFVAWCAVKIKHIDKNYICVYVALLVEALFIVNTRQVMFWMVLALAGSNMVKRKK